MVKICIDMSLCINSLHNLNDSLLSNCLAAIEQWSEIIQMASKYPIAMKNGALCLRPIQQMQIVVFFKESYRSLLFRHSRFSTPA